MKLQTKFPHWVIRVVVVIALAPLLQVSSLSAQEDLITFTGAFSDGATYLIEVPRDWNGTLFLYSHGYATPGQPNPPTDTDDLLVRLYLLSHNYALAGSSYAGTGWAVQDALRDQIVVLDKFNELVRRPDRTIAWGVSMGGLITAALVQKYPDRVSGAICFCGALGDAVGIWN